MAAWTEDAGFATAPGPHAARSGSESLAISGVPWITATVLLASGLMLVMAGGVRAGIGLTGLLSWGAKATPLILDRGETWRLLAANLLHKDVLHFAFNAFALWNVGGALERAVRPADYLAMLIFCALGTTLLSAAGSDSISLGASGMAFGALGASAAFGWRRGVRGPLRSYFGLRIVPWLLALFAAGLGSAGVDNWGHAGGLLSGALAGTFLTPRGWPGEGAARRLAAAGGAALGTIAMGLLASPLLPALGGFHDAPAGAEVRMPLGWRRAGTSPERTSFTNGLTAGFRAMAAVALADCQGALCTCPRLVNKAVTDDLWRLADVGTLSGVDVREEKGEVVGVVNGTEGAAGLSAVCVENDGARLAVVVMQPQQGNPALARRIAQSLRWPARAPSPVAGARTP